MNARTIRMVALTGAMAIGSMLGAQQMTADTLIVRTISLQFLSNADAAKLASPYIPPGYTYAGVFEAGQAVHAITVKAPARMLVRIDSLIKASDRAPNTVTLRLQVIAAVDSSVRDASIGELDAELHNLFRFSGYRLLSQNTVSVSEGSPFMATMRGPNGVQLTVEGSVGAVRRDAARSVQVYVHLRANARMQRVVAGLPESGAMPEDLLQTGLSIPMGQTVVVGSAISSNSTAAIILTVRPELSQKP
jgi:hypothetical protein